MFSIKKNYPFDYFQSFVRQADIAVQAALFLDWVLKDFQPEKIAANIQRMHEIEHTADQIKGDMIKKLIREFLPPIDKDDIIVLSHKIDDVIDSIEDVLLFIDVHDYTEIHPTIMEFNGLILESCQHMKKALEKLEHFKKSVEIYEEFQKVHSLKSKAKALYVKSLEYMEDISPDPYHSILYSELFQSLLDCCQNCKMVTNNIERIVIKNL